MALVSYIRKRYGHFWTPLTHNVNMSVGKILDIESQIELWLWRINTPLIVISFGI